MSSVPVRNVRPKPGYVFDGRSVLPIPMQVSDGLANVMTGRGTSVDRSMHNFWLGQSMPPQQIEAAYRSSWLIRQIVDIPAQDETRAGRDWDAGDDQIEKIEAEEKRLAYWAKVRQARIFGRLGGGALFINLGDDPKAPLPNNIRPEQVVSLIPLYRSQISLGVADDDVLSPYFNEPVDFRLNTAARPLIHRTRLVFFKGQSVPGFTSTNWEDRFWGDSVVQVVDEAVKNATTATAGFAALIDEAKIDVFKFYKLHETLSQPGGDEKVKQRINVATQEKSIHRSISLDAEDSWETRTLNFSGAKDMIVTLMGIAAGAANIPATKLLGKSPDGMNATGEGDERNYKDAISAGQESELRPALEQLDMAVLPSAGVPTDLPWKFSPLHHLSEKDEADIENKEADTVSKYSLSGLIPESALAKSVQNRLIESGRWPGLKESIEEAEAAGEVPPGDGNDLDIVETEGGDPASTGTGGSIGSAPPRRAE